MVISLEDIEDTLSDFEAWKSKKANPGALDMSMQAYMAELALIRNAGMIEEIRSIIVGTHSDIEAINLIAAVIDQNG